MLACIWDHLLLGMDSGVNINLHCIYFSLIIFFIDFCHSHSLAPHQFFFLFLNLNNLLLPCIYWVSELSKAIADSHTKTPARSHCNILVIPLGFQMPHKLTEKLTGSCKSFFPFPPPHLEHDECGSGQHNCDENAICTNTIRGHSCTCKPGYVGNGTICRGKSVIVETP